MSLLNDALQDLERAGGKANAFIAPSAIRSVSITGSNKRLMLPALAAVLVVAWAVVELDLVGATAAHPTAPGTTAVASALVQEAGAVAATPPAAQAQPATALPASPPVNEPPMINAGLTAVDPASVVQLNHAEPADNSRLNNLTADKAPESPEDSAVGALLKLAAHALEQDRLMTPVDNNAYQLYRSILSLEPSNAAAQAGIAHIQQRYTQLADAALQAQKVKSAQLYLQRAEKAGLSAEQLQPYRAKLKAVAAALPVRQEKPRIVFDKDADLAKRLRAESLSLHEAKAWARVRSTEGSGIVTMALADAYAATQNRDRLRELVDAAVEQEPQVSAYVQAQWLIASGDVAAAADTLKPYIAATELDHHLRLLAGVHAARSDYTQALPLYRTLTQQAHFHLNDWLGFAVALERVGERDGALAAYTKISRIRHADGRINDYIRGRIRALSSDF